jgi:hypothetical protein
VSVAAAACAPTTFFCTTTHDEKLLSLGVRESVIQFRRVPPFVCETRNRGMASSFNPFRLIHTSPALVRHASTVVVTKAWKGVGEYVHALTRALPWAGVWPSVGRR